MAGNKIGGARAAATNKKRYGSDYYSIIGKIGGQRTHASGAGPKGFAADLERARESGRKGGKISRRTKKVLPETFEEKKSFISRILHHKGEQL